MRPPSDAMVIMLSIHPSRFSDIVGTERITAGPDVPIGFYATALAMSAAGWSRPPAA